MVVVHRSQEICIGEVFGIIFSGMVKDDFAYVFILLDWPNEGVISLFTNYF